MYQILLKKTFVCVISPIPYTSCYGIKYNIIEHIHIYVHATAPPS